MLQSGSNRKRERERERDRQSRTLVALDTEPCLVDVRNYSVGIMGSTNSVENSKKLLVAQPLKKFPAFYRTQRFIFMFRETRRWTLL
jgi:hypothetical protein